MTTIFLLGLGASQAHKTRSSNTIYDRSMFFQQRQVQTVILCATGAGEIRVGLTRTRQGHMRKGQEKVPPISCELLLWETEEIHLHEHLHKGQAFTCGRVGVAIATAVTMPRVPSEPINNCFTS